MLMSFAMALHLSAKEKEIEVLAYGDPSAVPLCGY